MSEIDKQLIDSVIKFLSLYNGTILEKISHMEKPWINAINRLNDNDDTNNPIKLEDIEEYFILVKNKYKMLSYVDISEYATDMISKLI